MHVMTERRHPQRDRNPPVWPARVGPELEPLLQIVSELDTTQWWSQERLLQLQQMQLSALLNHARDNTDYYSAALKNALCEQLWTVFPREMNLTVASVTDIPRSKGGKFELFRSEIGTHERT